MIFLTKAFTKLHFIMGLVLLYDRIFTSGGLTASLHELGHLSHSKVRSQKCDSEPAQSSGRDVSCGGNSLWVGQVWEHKRTDSHEKRISKWKILHLGSIQITTPCTVYSCKEERRGLLWWRAEQMNLHSPARRLFSLDTEIFSGVLKPWMPQTSIPYKPNAICF